MIYEPVFPVATTCDHDSKQVDKWLSYIHMGIFVVTIFFMNSIETLLLLVLSHLFYLIRTLRPSRIFFIQLFVHLYIGYNYLVYIDASFVGFTCVTIQMIITLHAMFYKRFMMGLDYC